MTYLIERDGLDYKEPGLDPGEVLDLFPSDVSTTYALHFGRSNLSLASWWKPFPTSFVDAWGAPKGLMPDITTWTNATLVLSPKAHRLLSDLMEPWGEMLPLLINNETFFLFNPQHFGEPDKEAFEYDGTELNNLVKPAFKTDAVKDMLLYKCPVVGADSLYCNQRFKDAVQSFELSGLSFAKDLRTVWAKELPPEVSDS